MANPFDQFDNALSQQIPQPANAFDQFDAKAPPPASLGDRVQAGEAGVLKGAAALAGSIPDALPNLAGLGTSAYDAYQHYVNGKDWLDLPRPNEPNPVTRALTGVMDKSPITTTQLNRPDDTASRYLSAAGSAVTGGPRAMVPALAGQYVSEANLFDSPEKNRIASILAQSLGTHALSRPGMGPESPGKLVSNQSVRDAQAAGFEIPPATSNPTAFNRAIESIAGKQRVPQHAQVNNAERTNQAARNDMGIGGTGQVSDADIAQVRATAAPAYQAVRQVGPIQTGSDPNFVQSVQGTLSKFTGAGRVLSNSGASQIEGDVKDILSKPSSDSGDLLDTVGVLRDRSKVAFRAGDNGIGAAYKQVSDAIEQQIENQLPPGSPVLQNYRDARQKLAIAHTVEDARVEGSGNVNAQKLATMLHNGVPIQGELGVAAKAAGVAKSAFAVPNHSTGVSHLGFWPTLLGGMAVGHEYLPGHTGAALGAMPAALSLARSGATKYALGPGQKNAIVRDKAPIDARILAAGLASAQARQ